MTWPSKARPLDRDGLIIQYRLYQQIDLLLLLKYRPNN